MAAAVGRDTIRLPAHLGYRTHGAFKITAVTALSGRTSITVPAGWSAPQAANPAGAGYVTSANGTCTSAAKPTVTGTGPWTIAVAMNCAAGAHFTVTYGAGTGSTLVQAPAKAASYPFAASVKLGTTSHKLSVPPVAVQPGPAAGLVVSGLPNPGETGVPVPVTVTADDAFGNVATSYQGTVHFTSSDPGAATATAPPHPRVSRAKPGRSCPSGQTRPTPAAQSPRARSPRW